MNTRRTTTPTTSRRLGAFTSNEDANISRRRGMLYGTPVGGALVEAFLQGRAPRRRRASPAKCKSNNQLYILRATARTRTTSGQVVDGMALDKGDVIGSAVALIGVAIVLLWPRGSS